MLLRRSLFFLLVWLIAGVLPAGGQQLSDLPATPLEDKAITVRGADVLYLKETAAETLDANAAWGARGRFMAYESDIVDFGYLPHPVWVMFKVENSSEDAHRGVISLGRPELIIADIYTVGDRGPEILHNQAQDTERQKRLRKYLAIAEATSFAPGETKTILVRMRSTQSSLLPLTVGREAAMAQAASSRLIIFYMFSMMALTIVIVNIAFIVMLGQSRLLWFPASQIVSLASAWQINRLPNLFVEPLSRELSRLVDEVLMLGAIVLLLQFARVFFKTWRAFPATDKLIRLLMIIGGALLAIEAFGYITGLYSPGYLIGVIIPVWLASVLALVWTAFAAARRGVIGSWPILAAWLIFGGLVSYMVIESIAPLPPLPYQTDLLIPLVGVEAFLITHALGLFARRNTQDKIAAEQRLSEALRQEIITMHDLSSRSRLLFAMGHDGRNLLGGLDYLSKSIHQAETLEEAQMHAARLQDVSTMFAEMMNMMVDSAASGGGGQGPIAIEAVNVETLLSTVRMISGGAAETKAIPIHIHAGMKEVMTDHMRVFRILTNLVSNAGKYANRGRILIACRRSRDFARFQVFDQGEGLSPEELENLRAFKPVRFDEAKPGEGVGLTICRDFAEDLGGELRMFSRKGRGSLFELCLPVPKSREGRPRPVIGVLGAANDWQSIDSNLKLVPVTSLRKVKVGQVDAVLVDDHSGTFSRDEPCAVPVLVATFDKSSEKRAEWGGKAAALLYNPVTTEAVLAALAKLSIVLAERIDKGSVDDAYPDRRRS